MAIYDIFTFHNELELLLVRLKEHDPFVDKFVLLQGDRQHSGLEKPMYFPASDSRFSAFLNKIIVKNVELEKLPESAWVNENKQRNAAFEGIDFKPNDIVFLSDLDEIVSRNHWPYLISSLEQNELLQVWLEAFYYKLNLKQKDQRWMHPKIMKAKHFLNKKLTATEIRLNFQGAATPYPCGWHFSWLMDENRIQEKIRAFAHQEFNKPEFDNLKAIRDAIRRRRYLFHREMKLTAVKVDDSWPLEMLQSEFWKDYICPLERENLSMRERVENVWVDMKHFLRMLRFRTRAFIVPRIKKVLILLDPGFGQS